MRRSFSPFFLCLTAVSCFLLSSPLSPPSLSLSLFPALHAATLHSIIASDTLDWEMGPAATVDFKRIRHESRRIAEATGLELVFYEFRGLNYRAQAIVDCLQALDIAKEDVVLYFHSSHGQRTYSMGLDPLPILDFGLRNGLYLRDVVTLIEEKQPRLSVIIADCCNPWMDSSFLPPALEVKIKANPALGSPSIRELQYKQYQRLFLEPRGSIILLGSEPGGIAYTTKIYGSYCTLYWVHTLDRLSKSLEPVTWKEVLDNTQEMIKNMTNYSSPYRKAPLKPQKVWYSIELDTEETFISPNGSLEPFEFTPLDEQIDEQKIHD